MKKVILILIVIILIIAGAIYFVFNNSEKDDKDEINTITENKDNETSLSEKISIETDIEETEDYRLTISKPAGEVVGVEGVQSFLFDYSETFKKMAEEEAPKLRNLGSAARQYLLDVNTEIYESRDYLSYVIEIGEYTGGANANSTIHSFVYNKSNGERMALDEIVDSAERDNFVELVNSKLEEMNGTASNIFFEEMKEFYVTDSNYVVLFSKYEVAPGAAGIVSIEIPRNTNGEM